MYICDVICCHWSCCMRDKLPFYLRAWSWMQDIQSWNDLSWLGKVARDAPCNMWKARHSRSLSKYNHDHDLAMPTARHRFQVQGQTWHTAQWQSRNMTCLEWASCPSCSSTESSSNPDLRSRSGGMPKTLKSFIPACPSSIWADPVITSQSQCSERETRTPSKKLPSQVSPPTVGSDRKDR